MLDYISVLVQNWYLVFSLHKTFELLKLVWFHKPLSLFTNHLHVIYMYRRNIFQLNDKDPFRH